MNLKHRFKEMQKRAKQRGITTLEFVIWSALAVAALAVIINVLLGRQSEANMQRARQMIAGDIPALLTSLYQANGGTYAQLTADAAGKTRITSRGIAVGMPWSASDSWSVSTAGTATAVVLTFPTANARGGAQMATDLAASLTGIPMITSATATTTNLAVTYAVPQ